MRAAALDRRLEAVAGPPLASIFASSGTQPIAGELGAYEDRTIYGGIDIIDTIGTWAPLVSFGYSPSLGAILLQQTGSGSTTLNSRADTKNGTSNANRSSAVNVRVAGKSAVAWIQITSGMTQMNTGFNTPVQQLYYTGINPGDGMETSPSLVVRSTPSSTVLFGLAYRGAHDLATRTRILGWLMQRYQVMPPPPLDSTCCCRRADLVLAA